MTEVSESMEKPPCKFKRGDSREDGLVFLYRRVRAVKGGKYREEVVWITPEELQDHRAKATYRARERRKVRPKERFADTLRNYRYKQKFGITISDYEAMLSKQGGVCAICHRPCKSGNRLAVDHCHTSKVIRGLLCSNCNTGIGKFEDNPAYLTQAIEYLKIHQQN